MTEPDPDIIIREKCLDTAVSINMRYGNASADGQNVAKPNIWDILGEADIYFRYIKNGAFTPPVQ
jgi:hypothetical protein